MTKAKKTTIKLSCGLERDYNDICKDRALALLAFIKEKSDPTTKLLLQALERMIWKDWPVIRPLEALLVKRTDKEMLEYEERLK